MKIAPLFAALLLTAATPATATRPATEPVQSPHLYTPSPSVPLTVDLWGSQMPIDTRDLYERLDRELTAMTYTHGTTLLTLKRAARYRPVIEPILKENKVPADMFYLACIESNLDPLAVSPAKAAGIWQFMPATARQYGLEVNEYVDERYNLEKATRAACRYLKEAYAKYGDWYTVAAAYNAGQARISKELDTQRQQSALDLYLNAETSRYPFRIMAAKLIMENPSFYGFTLAPGQLYPPFDCTTETVDYTVDNWVDWASRRGLTYAELRRANPWIRAYTLPNKSAKKYVVKLPRPQSLSR